MIDTSNKRTHSQKIKMGKKTIHFTFRTMFERSGQKTVKWYDSRKKYIHGIIHNEEGHNNVVYLTNVPTHITDI